MIYPIKNRVDLENLEELASLQNQLKNLGLQSKLRKQNFHEDMEEGFELITDRVKDVSEDLTKTKMEAPLEGNETIANLNQKVLDLMNHRGIISQYLLTPLKSLIPNIKIQFELVKDS